MVGENILVTGFGPFGEHNTNASWAAVSCLPDNINGFSIVKQEIPVAYKYVEENIPLLWQKLKPKLVIHVGVNAHTSVITLEKLANKNGYEQLDVCNVCPKNGMAFCHEGTNIENEIKTGLCLGTISTRLKECQLKSAISTDPGRFLCEFIYYSSLVQDSSKTLFVHVPRLDQPYSKEELARGLVEIIKCSLELIDQEKDGNICPVTSPKIYKNGRAAAY